MTSMFEYWKHLGDVWEWMGRLLLRGPTTVRCRNQRLFWIQLLKLTLPVTRQRIAAPLLMKSVQTREIFWGKWPMTVPCHHWYGIGVSCIPTLVQTLQLLSSGCFSLLLVDVVPSDTRLSPKHLHWQLSWWVSPVNNNYSE